MTPLQFVAPQIDYVQIIPLIVVFLGACVGVGIETFTKRARRSVIQLVFTLIVVLLALVATIVNWLSGTLSLGAEGSLALDGPTHFIWAILLFLTALSLLVFAEKRLGSGATVFTPQAAAVPGSPAEAEAIKARLEHTEIYPLLLLTVTGLMLFPAANDLITMFVALEIFSLPLYLMCGMARRRRLLSQEAALKYFMLGSLSSAFFLYGVALAYGYAGSFEFREISAAVVGTPSSPLLVLGAMGMLAVGLLFKVGAVPFHSWTPDVYQGAPTPVTGFMAACIKIAAVGALLRVFYVAFGGLRWDWQPLMAIIAVLTMAVGSFLAITQTDIKRMLAYSSVAHAGFLLCAVTGASQYATGIKVGGLTSVSSVLFYLTVYGLATVGAFAIVTMVRDDSGEANSLTAWAGLGKKSPGTAAAFTIFLLSFAGIPLTSGFIGKWAVFVTAYRGGFAWLVVVAVLMSLVAAYFYLRVIIIMWFSEPAEDTRVVAPSGLTLTVVGIGCLATIVLGILPGPLLEVANLAGEFLR